MRETVGVYVDPRTDTDRVFRVLVVDDEPDILRSIQRFVEAALRNVKVVTAPSGPDALEQLRAGGIDAMLTDYKMPGMNGIELLAEARKLSPRMPAMMMTAYPDLDLAMRAVNDQGVTKFLTKPLDPARLVDILREMLEGLRREELRGEAFQRVMDIVKG